MSRPPGDRKRPATTDAALAALAAIGTGSLAGEELSLLRRSLSGRSALVVARAAQIAGNRSLADLRPELLAAFARFLLDPVKSDPGCHAKLAIVRALAALEREDEGVLLAGVRHVQREPVWGGSVDTAGTLRGTSLSGLVTMGHRDALFAAVPLLVDERVEARRLAAEALGQLHADETELLLRLKVATGDDEPLVLGDCFASLMAVNAERSLPFVRGYLEAGDETTAEGAALAIAESRHPDRYDTLRSAWQAPSGRRAASRPWLLLPMALTRTEEGFAFLVDLVAGGEDDVAHAALKALRVFRSDEPRRARVEEALRTRGDPALAAAFTD